MIEMLDFLVQRHKFQVSTHDLRQDTDPLTTLVLAEVIDADKADQPMSADDIAFSFDLPREEIDPCLKLLLEEGLIALDDDHYRYAPKRTLTKAEVREFYRITQVFREMSIAGPDPKHLDS
jgi:hypothetical protein